MWFNKVQDWTNSKNRLHGGKLGYTEENKKL